MRNPPWLRSALSSAPAEVVPGTDSPEIQDRVLTHAEVERLCRDHHDALIRYLVARLESVDEATEVAQEAYVRLLRLHDPAALSFLKALLYRTAMNLALDRIRQRRRRRVLDQEAAPETEAMVSPTRSPEVLWEACDDLAVIQASLNELPPRCRTIFYLARVEEVSVEEIAGSMNISVRSVWRYIARAMAHCQQRLDQAEAAGRRETKPSHRPSSESREMDRKPRR